MVEPTAAERTIAPQEPQQHSGGVPMAKVSGVPVLLAPSKDNLVTGGLIFRVGTADETAPIAGITHLVEHLAMSAVFTGSAHENGQTTATTTMFYVTGTTEQVVGFLSGVCAALRELPMVHLDREKEVIRTEGAQRPSASALERERYGATSHGIAGLDEFGMYRVTERDVLGWRDTWFTTGNAVAFLTMPSVPEGLDLALPDGPRRADPVPQQTVEATPAYISTGSNGIVLQGIVERSTATVVFAMLASRRLFVRLREEHGLSYTAEASHRLRDSTTSTLTMLADARQDTVAAMSELFLRTVRELRTGVVAPEELAVVVSGVRQEMAQTTPAQRLPSQALALLCGQPVRTAQDVVAEAEQVSEADIHRIAGQAWDTALLNCDPAAVAAVREAGFVPAEAVGLPLPESFKSFKRTGFNVEYMRFGEEGVIYQKGRTAHVVLFDKTVVMLCWPDGGRALMAHNASAMIIEPKLYSGLNAKRLAELVDTRMDPARVVHLPARDPKDIPKFGGRQLGYVLGLTLLLAISIPLLVAAVVAGFTEDVATAGGLSLLGAPFWIGTAWMIAGGRRRRSR